MSISVSPSAFRNDMPQMQKNYTPDALEQMKKEPTKVKVVGDVYESKAIYFKKLTVEELRHEKIDFDPSKHTYLTHSDGSSSNPNRLVAIRDPKNNGEVLVLDLSRKSIAMLEEKFKGESDFFERDDGVLRLNGAAEAFVAGWIQEIKHNRNYDNADADGNGLIEGDEAKNLTIGFERQNDYDYIGHKLVSINTSMSEGYQSLGRTPDAAHLFSDDIEAKKRSALFSQHANFENSVEKELDHTLQMDTDLDGTVTLDETLRDTFGVDYRKEAITNTQKFHDRLLDNHPELNDNKHLQNYSIGKSDIISEEEEAAMLESFKIHTEAAKLLFEQNRIPGPISLTRFNVESFSYEEKENSDTGVTFKELNMRFSAKSTYFGEADEAAQAGVRQAIEEFPEFYAKTVYGIDFNA